MKHMPIQCLFLALILYATGCAPPLYKGDMSNITNVPRALVEREKQLLEKRMNSWARQIAQQRREAHNPEKDSTPWSSDWEFKLRSQLQEAQWVDAMLERKLKTSGKIVDFTRQEWGRAEGVYCRLKRVPASSKAKPFVP